MTDLFTKVCDFVLPTALTVTHVLYVHNNHYVKVVKKHCLIYSQKIIVLSLFILPSVDQVIDTIYIKLQILVQKINKWASPINICEIKVISSFSFTTTFN